MSLAPPMSGADDKKDDAKKEKTKFVPPKLPDGYGNPKWDVSALAERYTIVKCEINEKKQISFLLELKENEALISGGTIDLYDKDGVKVLSKSFGFEPNMGKKGDRLRATTAGTLGAVDRDEWAKSVTLKVVLK